MRLPEDSLTRTTPELRARIRQAGTWTVAHELAAQTVDLLGILAADRRLRSAPQPVPRPSFATGGGDGGNGFAKAAAVLKASARTVRAG